MQRADITRLSGGQKGKVNTIYAEFVGFTFFANLLHRC